MADPKIVCRPYILPTLQQMQKMGVCRFMDFKEPVPADSTLSRSLNDLIGMGLVETTVLEPEKGRKRVFGYRLTDKGREMMHLIKRMEKL